MLLLPADRLYDILGANELETLTDVHVFPVRIAGPKEHVIGRLEKMGVPGAMRCHPIAVVDGKYLHRATV